MSVHLNPENSPNSPNSSSGKFLNRKPIIIGFSLMTMVLFTVVYSMSKRQQVASQKEEESKPIVISKNNSATSYLDSIPDGSADNLRHVPPPRDKRPDAITFRSDPSQEKDKNEKSEIPIIENKSQQTQIKFVDEEALRKQQRRREFQEQNYYEAVVSRTGIIIPSEQNNNQQSNNNTQYQGSASSQALLNALANQQNQISDDNNLNNRKEKFSKSNNKYDYLMEERTNQLTEFEIRVGTQIPAIMISGINSDLPGDIIAQVSQNVYDTKTGKFLLIPQGSKLIGKYDNYIAMGQKRVMVAWHRIQFPDASILNLGNMSAVDLSGYSGMKDKVNNHTFEIFKNAFLLSMIGAGSQIIIGESNSDNENSPSNTARAELGRQLGQVGTEMIRKNMNIQPTLEIRPGYQFNIMVNKDIILKPYMEM